MKLYWPVVCHDSEGCWFDRDHTWHLNKVTVVYFGPTLPLQVHLRIIDPERYWRLTDMEVGRTCYQLETRFAEPARQTSPANHPPMWSKWSEQSMPQSISRSEYIPSLRCSLFSPEKSSTLIYRCWPTAQTWNVLSESTYIFYTLIDAYNETVSTLCEFDQPMSNIGLLSNFVHVYFRNQLWVAEFGNFKLSVYSNSTMVCSWK